MYTLTEKKRISNVRRIETENEISEAEYLQMLEHREYGLRTVEKVRYKIPDGKLIWEVDIFSFWKKQAYLEVELDSEDEIFEVPAYLEVIREEQLAAMEAGDSTVYGVATLVIAIPALAFAIRRKRRI